MHRRVDKNDSKSNFRHNAECKKAGKYCRIHPYDVELCYGRYVVNAKSMLGVLSMPEFDEGELHIHTDNEKECEKILFQLLDQNLIVDTGDAVKRSIYDITQPLVRS